jgi:hypothetical protein
MPKIRIKTVPAMQSGGYNPMTPQQRDAWNRQQVAARQQGFIGNQHSREPGNQFMQSQGMDPNQLGAYQADLLEQRNTSPWGKRAGAYMTPGAERDFSPADSHYGKDTAREMYLNYNVQGKPFGTDWKAATAYSGQLEAARQNEWQNFGKPQANINYRGADAIYPENRIAEAPTTPKPTGLAATGFPTREEAISKYQTRKASGQELPSNYFLKGNPDYSIDTLRRTGKGSDEYAYGGNVTKRIRITGLPTMAEGGYANTGASRGYGNQQAGQGYALNRFWNSPAGYPGSTSQVNPYGKVGNTLPEAKDGGDINAEKQEMVLGDFDQDGQQELMNVNGKPHTEGGKNVNVPSNSFVFSDTKDLKIKDPQILAMFGMAPKRGGYTPAFIAKKYDLNKLKKILDDPNADEMSKKTAQLMYDNYLAKLNKLAGVQEQMKAEMGMEHHDPERGQVPAQEPPVEIAGNMDQGGAEMMQPEEEMMMVKYGGAPFYQKGGTSNSLMNKVLSGKATVAEIEEYNQKYNAQADEQLGTNYISNINPSDARGSGIGYTDAFNFLIPPTTSEMPHFTVPYNEPAFRTAPGRRNVFSKAAAAMANPFTAASYLINNQPLPDYFENDKNIYDNAVDASYPLALGAGARALGKMPVVFGKALSAYNAANNINKLSPSSQAIANNVQVPQNRTNNVSSPVASMPYAQRPALPQLPSSANNQNANQQVAKNVPAPYKQQAKKYKSSGYNHLPDYAPWDPRVGEQQRYPANAPQTTLDYQKWANVRGAKLKEDSMMGIKTIDWENPEMQIDPLDVIGNGYQSNSDIVPQTALERTVPTMAELTTGIPEKEDDKKKKTKDRTSDSDKQRRGIFMNPNLYGDAMNLAQMLQLQKFMPYSPVPQALIPETVFVDPTRAIAAQQEAARNAMEMNNQSANSRAARANNLAGQGIAGTQAADIIGQYGNQNVTIANAANVQAAQITNQLMAMEANRLEELNKGNFLAARDYQREMGRLQAEWADRKQKQHDTAVKRAWLNKTSPYFNIGMNEMPEFKPGNAEANYWKEIKGGNSTGTSISDLRASYIASGGKPDMADEYADDMYRKLQGINDRKTIKEKVGNQVISQSGKYGGMMRYGGSHMAMPQMAPQYQIGGGYIPLSAGPDIPMPAMDNTAYMMPPQSSQPMQANSEENPLSGLPTKKASRRDIATMTNNPGNMIYTPKFGKMFGAVDSGIKQRDGKGHFAMFPDLTTGLKAYQTQLFGEVDGVMKSNYYKKDTTVDQALKTWSNKGYNGDIYPEIKNKKLGELTMAERNELAKRQIKHESGDMYKLLRERGVFKYGGSALQKFMR